MANSYGYFWNSDGGDRTYDADSFGEWLQKFFTTGVFTGDLAVTADGTDMSVTVATGYANIEGKVGIFDSTTSITLATADGTYDRIDNIVVECNYSDREITIYAVEGTPASSPVAPDVTRDDSAYQLVIAQVTVAAGAVTISQADITDTRTDSELCGVVAGTVTEIDFSEITAQFEAYYEEFKESNLEDFNTWFEEMKGQLSEDAAGALQEEIDILNMGANSGQSKTTVFNSDGSITETWTQDNSYKVTVFNSDGSITETYYNSLDVVQWTKTTVFNSDGSITETVV